MTSQVAKLNTDIFELIHHQTQTLTGCSMILTSLITTHKKAYGKEKHLLTCTKKVNCVIFLVCVTKTCQYILIKNFTWKVPTKNNYSMLSQQKYNCFVIDSLWWRFLADLFGTIEKLIKKKLLFSESGSGAAGLMMTMMILRQKQPRKRIFKDTSCPHTASPPPRIPVWRSTSAGRFPGEKK